MDLLEVHRRIRLALNKDLTGYLSPEEIDRALDRAQLSEMRHLYGDDRKLPNSPLAYGMTLKIHADLNPFKQTVSYNENLYNEGSNTVGTGPVGVLIFPFDYMFPIAITVLQGGVPRMVKIVSEDEIAIRLGSAMRPPSKERPIAVLGGASINGFNFVAGKNRAQLFPEGAYNATLYYLSRPPEPSLRGVTNGRVFTYDRLSSVQLQWPDTAIERIIERAIAVLGENLQEGEIGNNNYNKAMQ